MITFPRAKINTGLNIIRKRSDGFHDIETIFYPVGLSDVLEFVVPAESISEDELTVTGFPAGCPSSENLAVRAAILMRERFEFPCIKIHLHKSIPPGSGLGGGSSDAAGMLMLLNRYFNLGATGNDLKTMALKLGSDCPFFIEGKPVLATGRGEIFDPLPCFLDGAYIVIIHEGIHISTPLAYSKSVPRGKSPGLKELLELPREDWREKMTNDFEDYAFQAFPVLADIKASLYRAGAFYSSMSGSGSAIYGLFAGVPANPALIQGTVIHQGWL
jgi:4-diphosphocytidyl-2-C-methyl-D-erythritol kinase